LTAAYQLAKKGLSATVLEADEVYVGGLSRTVVYKGFRFDIGGHRFFSKSEQVEALWNEILGPDLLERPRLSRILYGGKFYSYPLKPVEALRKLGLIESGLCFLSYLRARMFPVRGPRSFEDWVSNQFGARLFRTFFKTYTEKVWGISCREISADWAAQRIQGLSLWSAVKNGLRPGTARAGGEIVKTLIHSFRYPRLGPGMMWEKCAERVRAMGGRVLLGCKVTGCRFDADSNRWSIEYSHSGAASESISADHVISSAPLRELAASLFPPVSEQAAAAADGLRYRDFITVALIVKDRGALRDNWIYIHDPSVQVGRVQNYKAWSPEMVPDEDHSCYGLEYFCNEGNQQWESDDRELVALATRELVQIGLARREDVVDGCVVRQPKAYPVYDDTYARHVATLRAELQRYPNLHLAGRNGMHKYNNQDHAMMTAMLTVENIAAGRQVYDVWRVNQDAEYLESGAADEGGAAAGRQAPPIAGPKGRV
jgi:protoporphyrinogen oxidase